MMATMTLAKQTKPGTPSERRSAHYSETPANYPIKPRPVRTGAPLRKRTRRASLSQGLPRNASAAAPMRPGVPAAISRPRYDSQRIVKTSTAFVSCVAAILASPRRTRNASAASGGFSTGNRKNGDAADAYLVSTHSGLEPVE